MSRPDLLHLDLPFDGSAARLARRTVRENLAGSPSETAADIELIVSELVTNAVLHGAAPVALILRTAPGVISIEVCDGSPGQPAIPTEDTRRPHAGRGLMIVDGLSDHWGWRLQPPGKCVWAACSNKTN